jgi:hypothetical protein
MLTGPELELVQECPQIASLVIAHDFKLHRNEEEVLVPEGGLALGGRLPKGPQNENGGYNGRCTPRTYPFVVARTSCDDESDEGLDIKFDAGEARRARLAEGRAVKTLQETLQGLAGDSWQDPFDLREMLAVAASRNRGNDTFKVQRRQLAISLQADVRILRRMTARLRTFIMS